MFRRFLRLLAQFSIFSSIIVLSVLQSVGGKVVSPLHHLEVLAFEGRTETVEWFVCTRSHENETKCTGLVRWW